MEKFIQEYLSIYYKLDYSSLGNAGVYDINEDSKYRAPKSNSWLIKEISQVFYIDEDYAKEQIELWAITIDPEVDLDFYWKSINEIFFPTINRVHARTISMDLVSVQPMSPPRANLSYANLSFNERPIQISDDVRRVWESQLNELVGVSSRAIGEIDHPTDAIDAMHYSILNSYTGRTDIY
jgi:hypothetical protein